MGRDIMDEKHDVEKTIADLKFTNEKIARIKRITEEWQTAHQNEAITLEKQAEFATEADSQLASEVCCTIS